MLAGMKQCNHNPCVYPSGLTHFTFFQIVKDLDKLFCPNGQKPAHYIRLLATYICNVLASDVWWRMTGSNRRPPACKAGALPAELIPHSLTFDKRRGLAPFCLLLKGHRLNPGLIHHASPRHWLVRTKRVKAEGRAAYFFVGKRPDNAESRRLSQTNGGSGWARTNDPRLIKTVL